VSWRLLHLSLAIAALGCTKRSDAPEVHEDLSELSTYLRVPKGVESARWLIRGFPSTARGLPKQDGIPARGLAYLLTAPGFWIKEGAVLGSGTAVDRKFIETDARALFPAALVSSGGASGGWLELSCTSLAIGTLSAGARVTEALRCGDGLVVSFNIK
jgi:hypothetical protein